MNDLRAAVRQLSKSPGFTAVALLTLALCIGANSAIFSVVRGILLKPYPWLESDRLVYVYNTYPLMNLPNANVSIRDYLDRREQVAGFADSALYHSQSVNLNSEGEPERLAGTVATPSLFSTLRAGAQLGRVFNEEDALPGAAATVVLSQDLWRNRFGADPAIVGRSIRLNGQPVMVIGVMSANFYFPTPKTQLWTPFAFKPAERTDAERGSEYSSMIARLKPGATYPGVQGELNMVQARNAARLPKEALFWKNSGFGGVVQGFLEQNVQDVRGMLWLVQAGVAAALLIGCANVASLLLARALAREREFAVRAALGASRWRLIRMLLTESLLLFGIGGFGGFVVAQWALRALSTLGMSTLPRAFDISLDYSVFAFTLGSALLTGIGFGAFPAWTASGGDAAASLKEAGARGGTAGTRTQRLRSLLVVTEIALAVMLLATSALLVKSFALMQRQDPGFAPDGLLTAQLILPPAKYNQPAKIVAFHDAVMSDLAHRPGIKRAAFTDILPFARMNRSSSYSIPDIVQIAGAPAPHAQIRSADPEFLTAFGLRLQRGRWFTAGDVAGGHPVAVIDNVLANRYWPGQSPLGKRLAGLSGSQTAEIVGVVAGVKFSGLDETVGKETIYFPLAQAPQLNLVVLLKAEGNPATLAATLRAAVRAADPEQPVFDLQLMRGRMSDAAQPRRAPMLLLSLFSAVALLLAVVGVYGVLSFTVAQRTAEFGVRVALGATPAHIAGLVLQQAGGLVAAGLATGLAGYFAVSRIIARLLYGVGPNDWAALSIALIILAFVALTAALIPARHATRISPLAALRAD